MARTQVESLNLSDNKAILTEHVDRIIQCAVGKKLIVPYNASTFLCETDNQRIDHLDMKIKLIDSKLAHYKREKKKAVEIRSTIMKGRNVKDYISKGLSSKILHLIPDHLLHSILDQCQPGQYDDVFSAMDKIQQFNKKESSTKECNGNVSDNETIVEKSLEEVCLAAKLKSNKRKRRQTSDPKPSKKSRPTSLKLKLKTAATTEQNPTCSQSNDVDTDEDLMSQRIPEYAKYPEEDVETDEEPQPMVRLVVNNVKHHNIQ